MIIKLQPDQVSLFWDMIKKSMIGACKIPKDYQQDYAINSLHKLLSGLLQCWISYKLDKDNEKRIHAIIVTSIIDRKNYGVRVLNVEALYGFRLITMPMVDELYKGLEEFALANKCDVLTADYSNRRVKEFLHQLGFEEHSTICRKIIR